MLWITLHTVLLSTVMWRIVLFYYYLVHQDKTNNTNQSSASLKFCRGFSFPRNFSRQLPLSNWRSCFCICACFCLLCSFKSYLVFYFVWYRMFLLGERLTRKYILVFLYEIKTYDNLVRPRHFHNLCGSRIAIVWVCIYLHIEIVHRNTLHR